MDQFPAFAIARPESLPVAKPDYTRVRLFGLLLIAVGVGAWWYNWYTAATAGEFSLRLTILGPAGVFGGLLLLLRPDWSGRLHTGSSPAQKIALFSVMGLIAVGAGVDYYLLKGGAPPRAPLSTIPRMAWSPAPSTSTVVFLGNTYELKSFHAKPAATWEFGTPAEPVNNWTRLLTLIDRPDARTREDLDRLAEGVMANYKSHSGQILMAKSMQDASGKAYNYMVVAFEEPATRRYELNFVKVALGAKNATIAVYGVRITDPGDYQTKAKQFLTKESGGIGKALETAVLPDLSTLPRKEF